MKAFHVLLHLIVFNPSLKYLGTKTRVRFSGSYLKPDKITYTHEKIVNIYIVMR